MDKNRKIFNKLNVIDIAAILIIILAAIGITIRFTSIAAKNVTKTTSFSYVVLVEDIREYGVNALNKKGKATDWQENVIGEITNVEVEEMDKQIINENGESVRVVTPERYRAKVTIEAEGKDTENGYFIGENTELAVGSGVSILTKYSSCSGKIIEVNKQENQGE